VDPIPSQGVSGTGSFGDGELNPHPNYRSLLPLFFAVSTEGPLHPDHESSDHESPSDHESHRPLGEPVPPSQRESPLPLTFTYHACPAFRQTDYFPLGPFPSVLLFPTDRAGVVRRVWINDHIPPVVAYEELMKDTCRQHSIRVHLVTRQALARG
jgi:hypothetical protein